MITVVVASTNPVKQAAVRVAFEQVYGSAIDVIGCKVPSGVADQPMTDEETKRGAINRAHHARAIVTDADFWVGVEGGAALGPGGLHTFGWMVVLSPDRQSCARSASFLLPEAVARQMRAGGELGPAMDIFFREHNSKHKGGAIGLLTKGVVPREALYVQPLIFALIPFLQPDLYPLT